MRGLCVVRCLRMRLSAERCEGFGLGLGWVKGGGGGGVGEKD